MSTPAFYRCILYSPNAYNSILYSEVHRSHPSAENLPCVCGLFSFLTSLVLRSGLYSMNQPPSTFGYHPKKKIHHLYSSIQRSSKIFCIWPNHIHKYLGPARIQASELWDLGMDYGPIQSCCMSLSPSVWHKFSLVNKQFWWQ